jgi:hypothetical protein
LRNRNSTNGDRHFFSPHLQESAEISGTKKSACHRLCLPILLLLFAAAGCSYDMSVQPSYRPMSESGFFSDQRSARPLPVGTVAREQPQEIRGPIPQDIPLQITIELLRHGRERFDIYCSTCHGRLGNGEGMVVQRGFSPPPSFHLERLRSAPDSHYFGVITYGIGRMWDYGNRTSVQDRWAITSYIRVLQLSQSAPLSDVPQSELRNLRTEQ